MKKEFGALVLGTYLLGGCNSLPNQNEIPTKILVDCQKDPLGDSPIQNLNWDGNNPIKIGGITKDGKEDTITLKGLKNGKLEFDQGHFDAYLMDTGTVFEDGQIVIFIDTNNTNAGAACFDSMPKNIHTTV